MAPGDVEAVGVKEGKLWFLLYPLAGGVEQALLPLVLISFCYPHFCSHLTQEGQLRPPQAAETIM